MNINCIVVADDHELIRKGLIQTLSSITNATLIEAKNGIEAIEKIREYNPEVAILDFEMPELTGYEVAELICSEKKEVNIIFLTMYKDESVFNKAMELGVKGYLLKENTVSEIEQCLKSVMQGNYFISAELSNWLLKKTKEDSRKKNDFATDLKKLLTPTEFDILELVSEMRTSQEIANVFGVSLKTIQNHRNNICVKLGLSGAHALLKFAIEQFKTK